MGAGEGVGWPDDGGMNDVAGSAGYDAGPVGESDLVGYDGGEDIGDVVIGTAIAVLADSVVHRGRYYYRPVYVRSRPPEYYTQEFSEEKLFANVIRTADREYSGFKKISYSIVGLIGIFVLLVLAQMC